MQKWVTIDEKYLYLLRQIDNRVPFSDYGKDKYKPFFGTLFEKDELVYVVAISHATEKHRKMKNAPDFIKVYISDNKNEKGEKLAAVVNLRYMIPVPKANIEDLKYSDIDKHRTFKNDKEKSTYIDLMQKELETINQIRIEQKAEKLYSIKINYPDNEISKRCLDFIKLEDEAKRNIKGK